MRISDWSSDVCSSDLEGCPQEDRIARRDHPVGRGDAAPACRQEGPQGRQHHPVPERRRKPFRGRGRYAGTSRPALAQIGRWSALRTEPRTGRRQALTRRRSEEHTSELQSLMRISYAVFCLKKKKSSTKKE